MVTLLYFGRLSDVTGGLSETLDIPKEISTLESLRHWVDERHGGTGALTHHTVRIAVDGDITPDQATLQSANEIAFMPPVGGG